MPPGHVHRRHERRERESRIAAYSEERPEVDRAPARPAADEHRRGGPDPDERREDADGRDQPTDPALDQRPDALSRGATTRVAGVVIEFHSPMSRMNRTLPTRSRARASRRPRAGAPPRAHDEEEQPRRSRRRGPERDRRPAAGAAGAPARATGRRGTPGRAPRRRARRRSGTASPARRGARASANERGSPLSPRAASQSAPATSGW